MIAVLCSDLHITSLKPNCRAEDDWWEIQQKYLEQLKAFADGLPIICAGDVFDRWNPNPETINFALQHLPDGMVCVAGQHDLPNHRLDQMGRSAYGSLVMAGKIRDISEGGWWHFKKQDLTVFGAGWDQMIPPVEGREGSPQFLIAAVHRYIWTKDASYPGAPVAANVKELKNELKGYDAAVFGDNHKHFIAKVGDCNVINTGGFIRRKTDEINYLPRIGALMSDRSVASVPLNVDKDKFHATIAKRQEVPVNMKEFIDEIEKLGDQGMDFKEAVRNHLRDDDIDEDVKKIILQSIES